RHTVSGVASSKPIGPHSVVQKMAARMIATAEMLVLDPYSHGSTKLLLTISMTTTSPSVSRNVVQPGSTATASSSGNDADSTGPRYGMKRRKTASTAHSAA